MTESALKELDDAASSIASSKPGTLSASLASERAEVPDISQMNLVDARRKVKSLSRDFIQKWKTKHTSPAFVLRKLVEKLGDDHTDVKSAGCSGLFGQFDGQCEKMLAHRANANTWTVDTYVEHFKNFMQDLGLAREFNQEIADALQSLKSVNKDEVKERTTDRRKNALKCRYTFKENPLGAQGFPPNLVTWFGCDVMGIAQDKDVFGCVDSLDLEFHHNEKNVVKQWSLPVLWKVDSAEEAIGNLDCCCQSKFTNTLKTTKVLKRHLMTSTALSLNMARASPVNKSEDTLPWLPATFADNQPLKAEYASTVGVPWVLAAKRWGFRGTKDNYPFWGLSHFLLGLEGSSCAMVFSLSEVLKSGGTMDGITDMLNGLTPKAAGDWMSSRCKKTNILQGDVFWVPMGSLVWLVGTSQETAITVQLPVLSTALLQSIPKDVKQELSEVYNRFLSEHQADAPWKDLAGKFGHWLSDS